jgi:hypothetical protein
MTDELDRQISEMVDHIMSLVPEARVEVTGDIFEDEHANLEVYPPLDWDEERCLDLQHEISKRVVDIHVDTGYFIAVYVYLPEQQVEKAKQERVKARYDQALAQERQKLAEKVLSEAQELGLYRPTGVD